MRWRPTPAVRTWHECASTVSTCGAPALARTPVVARPVRGGGASDVSTRGLRERCGARFQGGILTEATARRGGGRRPAW
jgi:hypothetical protein